jgi:glyoxylase-like metal-dependent hydrolase (beta-lactamase superfamily II)
MRITAQMALVASGASGFGLSNRLDCNVYLIDGGGESALVDAGCGLEPERILGRIEMSGIDPQTVSQVLLTHCHADHSAGARFWSESLDAAVVAPKQSADALRSGDEDVINLKRARAAGVYPADFFLPPVPVSRSVDEGDLIRVGSLQLEVLKTPGHSFDHVAYLLQGSNEVGALLFSGDVLLTDGRIMLLDAPDCRIDAYGQTIRRLAGLQVEGLMPGHGAFMLHGAGQVVAKVASYFDRMLVPPSWM